MSEKYEHYNEVTFISYSITSIDHAIARGLQQKQRRAQRTISFSDVENKNFLQDGAVIEEEIASDFFEANGLRLPVVDKKLAAALRQITPERRIILLLAYFVGESDAEISEKLHLSKSTVQHRRTKAVMKIKELMEVSE